MSKSQQLMGKVLRTIEKYRMLSPGQKVIVAVSGGPDSVVLLHVLTRIRDLGYAAGIHVAHLNHRLRGEEADRDADYVVRLASDFGAPATVKSVNVRELSERLKTSVEDAGRRARYQFFEELAASTGADRIAVGHTADDQAETVMMRLLRGSGPAGLAGIPPVRGKIIRPLIEVWREEIEEYCSKFGLVPVTDETNLSTAYFRNRIRLELLPLLEREHNPKLKPALVRLAELCRDDNDFMEDQARKAFDCARVSVENRQIVLDVRTLSGFHKAIMRRVIRMAYETVTGSLEGLDYVHVDAVSDLLSPGRVLSGPGSVELPGGVVARMAYGRLSVAAEPLAEPPGAVGAYELNVPGITEIPAIGVIVEAQTIDSSALLSQSGNGRSFEEELRRRRQMDDCLTEEFDLDKLDLPLSLRFRREGDRFTPLGHNRPVKLKDFLIKKKIPKERRDFLPLIVDGSGIIWVVGVRMSNPARVTEKTQRVLRISIRSC